MTALLSISCLSASGEVRDAAGRVERSPYADALRAAFDAFYRAVEPFLADRAGGLFGYVDAALLDTGRIEYRVSVEVVDLDTDRIDAFARRHRAGWVAGATWDDEAGSHRGYWVYVSQYGDDHAAMAQRAAGFLLEYAVLVPDLHRAYH